MVSETLGEVNATYRYLTGKPRTYSLGNSSKEHVRGLCVRAYRVPELSLRAQSHR